MPRKKGSKNKVVEAAVKEYFDEEPKQEELIPEKGEYPVLKASPFEEQIKSVLSHILELFKASLIDAFKQYVKSRIAGSLPASVEEFVNQFKHTTQVHGIADETLLASLDEVELEYLSTSTQVVQPKQAEFIAKNNPVPAVPEKKKEATSVFDALDII